jgi:hypothetical protein
MASLTANLLIIGTLLYGAALYHYNRDFYYQSSQEDEHVEWSTFYAFLAAAGASIVAGLRQRRVTGQIPWFLFGVGLFCFFVAMEEISWGQRLLGFRPPTYFLEKNFQEELNIHNVVGTKYRMLVLKAVILGYGVVLPLLALVPSLGRLLRRAAVVPSPVALAPAFLANFLVYQEYPYDFTGEWVELALGLGFLFATVSQAQEFRPAAFSRAEPPRVLGPLALAWLIVIALGFTQAALTRVSRAGRPEYVEAARGEVEALARDLARGRLLNSCSVHKRVYSYVEKYRKDDLLKGEFAQLTKQGMPEERAEYFLDPWNLPYWIRYACPDGSRRSRVFVYSFGPNRKRDSSELEILGDDVGAFAR